MNLRQRILPVILGMGLLAFLPIGCAINPVSGKSETVLISAEKEKALGAEEAKKVEKSMGLVDDPEIVAYVKAVGRRLTKHSPRKDVRYTFRIVDMKEPMLLLCPGDTSTFPGDYSFW